MQVSGYDQPVSRHFFIHHKEVASYELTCVILGLSLQTSAKRLRLFNTRAHDFLTPSTLPVGQCTARDGVHFGGSTAYGYFAHAILTAGSTPSLTVRGSTAPGTDL